MIPIAPLSCLLDVNGCAKEVVQQGLCDVVSPTSPFPPFRFSCQVEAREHCAHLSSAFCTALTSNPTPALCSVTRDANPIAECAWKVCSSGDGRKKGLLEDERANIGGSRGLWATMLLILVLFATTHSRCLFVSTPLVPVCSELWYG